MRQLTFILFFIIPFSAWSHGDLHDQIHDVSTKLHHDMHNAALYLKRGQLYLKDETPNEAIRDFRKALDLDSELMVAHYHLAQALLTIGESDTAERHARLFIASLGQMTYGGLSRGYGLLGRIYQERNDPINAAEAYEKSLQNNMQPRPFSYLRVAEAYVQSGQQYHQQALNILDKGIDKLGPIVTLQEAAIELELLFEHYDAALTRVRTLRTQGLHEANIHFKQASIMSKAQRLEEAQAHYKMALTEIDRLPTNKQSSRAMLKLRLSIEEELSE